MQSQYKLIHHSIFHETKSIFVALFTWVNSLFGMGEKVSTPNHDNSYSTSTQEPVGLLRPFREWGRKSACNIEKITAKDARCPLMPFVIEIKTRSVAKKLTNTPAIVEP